MLTDLIFAPQALPDFTDPSLYMSPVASVRFNSPSRPFLPSERHSSASLAFLACASNSGSVPLAAHSSHQGI
jgi:hypothetical protein